MAEPSPTTPPAETAATPTTQTVTTPPTSSTTPPTTQETKPSSEAPESVLSQKPEPAKEEPKEPPKPEGAPEKYEAFKAPEGYEINPKVMEEATAVFKELNLPQPTAQKLVDFYSKTLIESAQASAQAFKDTRAGWVKEANAIPELAGGLGPGGKVITAVGRMLDQIGDAKLVGDFKQAMDMTGAGDNPAFIRVMYQLAQRLGEGTPVSGNSPAPQGQSAPGSARKSAAQEIYPNLSSGR